jgi:WXG100 family type VII secretion target
MRYEVDSDRVQQASTKVAQSSSAVQTEVNAMMRHLTDLQTVWKGGASTAFAGVMAQWQAAQHQVEEALQSVHNALAQAAQTYVAAEEQATHLFRA